MNTPLYSGVPPYKHIVTVSHSERRSFAQYIQRFHFLISVAPSFTTFHVLCEAQRCTTLYSLPLTYSLYILESHDTVTQKRGNSGQNSCFTITLYIIYEHYSSWKQGSWRGETLCCKRHWHNDDFHLSEPGVEGSPTAHRVAVIPPMHVRVWKQPCSCFWNKYAFLYAPLLPINTTSFEVYFSHSTTTYHRRLARHVNHLSLICL